MMRASIAAPESAVLHVGGLYYASEKALVERVLARRPGVISVEANPVAQTATVVYDPDTTSVEALHIWVEECGYHCAGQSAPGHICDPLVAPDHGPHDHEATARADEADGHGHGGHAGMSMAGMVADMRDRFTVSLIFTLPIVLWSRVGSRLFGSELATPFGMGRNWWLLLLSLPVVLYSSSIFFTGALQGAARPDARHDGAGRGRRRDRMASTRPRSPPASPGRRVLRRGGDAGDVRAARALV